MKILKKIRLCAFFTLTILFFGINMQADAAYYVSNCNSPCENPCTLSRTICEGSRCTTYCSTSCVYDASWNYTPGVTFSYSVPNVSFSISNEYVGLNVVKFNGRPAVYYHKTNRPIVYHKPIHVSHPVYRPGHINSIKPAPNKPNKPGRPNTHKPGRH